jgi:aryl-alcohol dehydrogenase-like predicted oxidoreductase
MQHQGATEGGTADYSARFPDLVDAGHFRKSREWRLSSIGLGTYLGHYDERTDEAYGAAVKHAVALGCNVIDSAANYRFQRSERAIGEALAELFTAEEARREEIVVTTKGGYLPFDGEPPQSRAEMMTYLEETFVKPGVCGWEDFVQGSHCMTPRYLAHQLTQSLANLRLATIDVYYLHNPESQFAEIGREGFYARLRSAFEYLESAVAEGKIVYYGTATWNGYRVSPNSPEFLSLERVVATAREVGGEDHHFRVVQLPYNLEMTEALTMANQPLGEERVSLLKAASVLGVTVMASASLLQAKLTRALPASLRTHLGNFRTDAQMAIQFARSAPEIATALIGMSRTAHVEENLATAQIPPVIPTEYLKLFKQKDE